MFVLRKTNRVNSYLKHLCTSNMLSKKEIEVTNSYIEDTLQPDEEYSQLTDSYLSLKEIHSCFIIYPYVKWGPRKLKLTPNEQLQEAEALVKTLPRWQVEDTMKVPLETLDKKTLFGTGNMKTLAQKITSNPNVTAVFINVSSLKQGTTEILRNKFKVPIFDRYRIVIQILKVHATSKHAKLQVALAELYYIQRKAQEDMMRFIKDPETLKLTFQSREQKLKDAIQKLRSHRMLLRSQRRKLEYPVVAVVGYTNAGKTSLIKALTGDASLIPIDRLFATLDVTVYKGMLPSGMEVLYIDTVGFLSELPTNLLECFIATLEDAVLADVILHVEDLSCTCLEYHKEHVLNTLEELGSEFESSDILKKVISVGNKSDCALVESYDALMVSAKEETGLDDLRLHLEQKLLEMTSRRRVSIKVLNGGDEIRWLYKNATVISANPDDNVEFLIVKVIITDKNLSIFKNLFIS